MNIEDRISLIKEYQEKLSEYDDPVINEIRDVYCPRYILDEKNDIQKCSRWLYNFFYDEPAMKEYVAEPKVPCSFLNNSLFVNTPDSYKRIGVLVDFFTENRHLIEDKTVMDYGAGSAALAIKLSELGAKRVTVVEASHHGATDIAFSIIRHNVPNIDVVFQMNRKLIPKEDIIIGSGIFDEDFGYWLPNWRYVNDCQAFGKEVYLCSQRILKGEHPYIKPVEPNILYHKNGISIFNKFGKFELNYP